MPQAATAAGSAAGAPPPAAPAPAAQPAEAAQAVMAPPPSQPAPARQGQSSGEVSGYRVSAADTVEGFREDDYPSSSRARAGSNKGRTRQPQTTGSIPDPEGWINS
jgi:hypothetical protein